MSSLETKVESFDAKLRASKEREKELRSELDSALSESKDNGSVSNRLIRLTAGQGTPRNAESAARCQG